MRYWLIPIAAAITLAGAVAQAQTAAPQPQTTVTAPAPTPSPAQAAPVPVPAASTDRTPAPSAKTAASPARADKSCIAAGRKLDRERNSLAYAKDETARYSKASQSCATKSTCARYKAALDSLEKRVARHERRIETFTANRNKACKT